MKKCRLLGLALFFGSAAFSQPSQPARNYVNANLVPNGTGAITASKLNIAFSKTLDALDSVNIKLSKVPGIFREKIRNVTLGQRIFYASLNPNGLIVFQRNGITIDPDFITQNINGVTFLRDDIIPGDVIILQYIPIN